MAPPVHPASQPEALTVIIDLFGNPVRVEILRLLRLRGPATCADLCRALAISHPATLAQLALLERHDLVQRQPTERPINGQVRTAWLLREQPLVQMAAEAAAYLTGRTLR